MSEAPGNDGRISRRALLKLAAAAGTGIAFPGACFSGIQPNSVQPLSTRSRSEFPVNPYISREEHLDSLPAPKLSFYKQPWRGYLETVPATQFLSGIGMNYSLPQGAPHEPVLQLMADSGVRHVRIEIGWSEVPWDESALSSRDYYSAILVACRKYRLVPLILLNAHHGVPGPNKYYERKVTSGGETGSRTVMLDSVQDLISGRSGLSNLSDYKMCEAFITAIDQSSGKITLSKPLPKAIAPDSTVAVNTLKYLPLYPAGTSQFAETLAGWRRYVDLVLRVVVDSEIQEFDTEIWNELTFGSDYLSINNYYETPVARTDGDFLQKGGQAYELGKQTVDQVKRSHRGARAIWGFSNTDWTHTRITDLPAGLNGQSYHPYGTGPLHIPWEFPPPDQVGQYIEGFVPQVTWAQPEGHHHLAVTQEQLPRGFLEPRVRNANKPPGTTSFAHYMTEHGFVAKEAGLTDGRAAQAYKAKALIRALTFWLNKGISRLDIFTIYAEHDADAGMLWADPKPPTYAQQKPALSPALAALQHLVRQFAGAEALSRPRQLGLTVKALGGQPNVFQGEKGHPAFPYREMFTFLPFQVNPHRFVAATYVMSYDITSPPPPMRFQLEIRGVDGRRVSRRYYDPILNRDIANSVDGRSDTSITLTMEQTEYPRLIVLDER